MITSIGLSRLRPRLVPNGTGAPKGLIEAYSLCSAMYSVELAVKEAVKVRPLFRATSVLAEKILHFFQITGIPI